MAWCRCFHHDRPAWSVNGHIWVHDIDSHATILSIKPSHIWTSSVSCSLPKRKCSGRLSNTDGSRQKLIRWLYTRISSHVLLTSSSLYMGLHNWRGHLYYYRRAVHKNLSSQICHKNVPISSRALAIRHRSWRRLLCTYMHVAYPLPLYVRFLRLSFCFLRQKIINNVAFRYRWDF